jgi:pyruvate/2-oxoglutarate dehydrogenase complex dihydrolipoamide acyltransferase (E2) component
MGDRLMEIRMPKLGMEMTEAVLSRWLVDDGSRVENEEPIYEIETEKVESEVLSPQSGTLRHVADAGQTYPVGKLLGYLDD